MKSDKGSLRNSVLFGLVFLFAAASGVTFSANEVLAQTRPAITKNVDEPGRVPYQQFLNLTVGGGGGCGTNFCDKVLPAVPANQRLVITNISGSIPTVPAARPASLRIYPNGHVDSSSPFIEIPIDPALSYVDTMSDGGPRRYPFNVQVQLFAETRQTPTINFYTIGGNLDQNGWPTTILVSGYSVDLAK